MALRDQPYLPLYVQDFLTDEKLIECSAATNGIYIRIMCIMHKSDEYGTILLKQKDKQKDKQIENFALKLAKHLPYSESEIKDGIFELVEYGVLKIEGNKLFQKRMIRDNEISIIRSDAGKKGVFAKAKLKAKTKAKVQANIENENEIKNDIEDLINKREIKFKSEVFEFLDRYTEIMLNNFCIYWTEKNRSKTKMRFELEKTFEISKRLITWSNRDKDYNKIEKSEDAITYKEMISRFNNGEIDIQEKYEPVTPGDKRSLWKPKK